MTDGEITVELGALGPVDDEVGRVAIPVLGIDREVEAVIDEDDNNVVEDIADDASVADG